MAPLRSVQARVAEARARRERIEHLDRDTGLPGIKWVF